MNETLKNAKTLFLNYVNYWWQNKRLRVLLAIYMRQRHSTCNSDSIGKHKHSYDVVIKGENHE